MHTVTTKKTRKRERNGNINQSVSLFVFLGGRSLLGGYDLLNNVCVSGDASAIGREQNV